MKNFRKNIYRTQTNLVTPEPPEVYTYYLQSGDRVCTGGVLGTINVYVLTVYTTVLMEDWIIGTKLYSDPGLTLGITNPWSQAFIDPIQTFIDVNGTVGIVQIIPATTPC